MLDLKPVCQNDGTADISEGLWRCTCSNQFTGTYCETGMLFDCTRVLTLLDLKPIYSAS